MLGALKYRIVIIALFTVVSSLSPVDATKLLVTTKVTLGVKVGMLPSGDLHQFALIYYRNGVLASIQPVSEDRMVKVGAGKWPIPGTHKFHDFFAEEEMYIFPSDTHEVFNINASVDSLWKVRFAAHPYSQSARNGWSQGDYRPSLKQRQYIYDRYGVRGYDQDYFIDSSFFKLLKDVQDPDWIKEYKSMY